MQDGTQSLTPRMSCADPIPRWRYGQIGSLRERKPDPDPTHLRLSGAKLRINRHRRRGDTIPTTAFPADAMEYFLCTLIVGCLVRILVRFAAGLRISLLAYRNRHETGPGGIETLAWRHLGREGVMVSSIW